MNRFNVSRFSFGRSIFLVVIYFCILSGVSFAQSAHLLGIDLMEEYDKNEVAADLSFKDKEIFVSGAIDSIGKDILGTPYVVIDKNKGIFGVQCMFNMKDLPQLASLRKGQLIHVIGVCNGKMGNVVLKNCRIFKAEN